MLVSLIVTTRGDRIDKLNRFLASLRQGVYQLIEVILVSQDCSTLVLPVLQQYQSSYCLKHLPYHRCGVSRARNFGLHYSSGRIVGFPDDDCWYEAHTLSQIVERFSTYPDEAFICTSVVDPIRQLPFGHRRTANKNIGISVVNAFTYPISPGIFIHQSLLAPGVLAFDEQLGVGEKWGSGEETDLILSLLSDGYKGSFVPAITVYHEINYDRPDLFPIAKVFSYARGFAAVIAKNLTRRKQYAISWVYADLLARAAIRLTLACLTFRKSSYLNHLSKTKGMLIGLFEGAKHYAR